MKTCGNEMSNQLYQLLFPFTAFKTSWYPLFLDQFKGMDPCVGCVGLHLVLKNLNFYYLIHSQNK